MLKLIKLSLEGFGCFKEEKVFEYTDGINVVSAQNGKGKSTAIEAIELLLLSNLDGNYSDYLYRDKKNKVYANEFTISLEFMLNKYHLLEILTCKKGSKTCTTTRNLKDLESSKDIANGEEVKTWLNEHLPSNTTKYALFVRQNSNMDIINATDSERRELFKNIQDLNFSSEIKTLIDPKLETVKQSIIDVDKEIFAFENKTYETKDFMEVPFSEDEYKLKKSQLEKLKAEKALIEEKKNRFNELLEKKQKLMNDISEMNTSVSAKKSKIESYNETISNSDIEKDKLVTRCEENKNEIESQISSLKSELDNLEDEKNDEIKDYNNLINDISKEIEDFTNEMNSIKLTKLIKFDDTSLINTRNNLSELTTKKSIAVKNAESLSKGVCPICGGNCTNKHDEIKLEIDSLENQIEECENLIADLNDKKSVYEKNVEINQKNKELKTSLQGKIETKKAKLESLNESLSSIDELYESKQNGIKSKIENAEQKYSTEEETCKSNCLAIDEKCSMLISQKKELEDEIIGLNKKVEDSSKELLSVNKKIDEYEDSESKEINTDELESELKSYDDTVSQNKVISEYNKNVEETKKKDKKELEELKAKKQKFEDEKFDLESAKVVMTKDYPNFVIENSIKNIEDDINDFISNVYYKELDVSFDSTKTGIKMTFGEDIPIKRLSGCESAITKIGFINSFNKNLQLGMILLDEPDSAMSDNIKNEFYNSLLEMNSIFNQIILVSHSEKMVNFIRANTECNIITL